MAAGPTGQAILHLAQGADREQYKLAKELRSKVRTAWGALHLAAAKKPASDTTGSCPVQQGLMAASSTRHEHD